MQPRLSVVVSLHNAAEHLTECLESIAGQTLSCFEAVLVDDGSTDDTAQIAEDFTAHDQRFRYVRQDHAGPSAARNRGVRETPRTVDFLTFADGTDVVAHDAYARLTTSLDTTGSAFASGNVWQLGGHGRRQDPSYRWLAESRPRTHITRDSRLLADHTARNKMFRRAFWDRHGFSFPEGRRYAAPRVTIPAHFLAGSVDLVREHVCYRRVGPGAGGGAGAGDTVWCADPKAVRDRIAACEHISRFLSVQQPAHRAAYDASCLRTDLVPFLEALPAAGPAYREAFLATAPEFVARATPAAFDALPAALRVKWHLVLQRRLTELIDLLVSGQGDDGTAFRVRGRFLRDAVFAVGGSARGTLAGGLDGVRNPPVDRSEFLPAEPSERALEQSPDQSAGQSAGRSARNSPAPEGPSGRSSGRSSERSPGRSSRQRPGTRPRRPAETVALARLARGDLPVVARVREITWAGGSGKLLVKGYAYVCNLDAANRLRSVKTGFLTAARDGAGPGAGRVRSGRVRSLRRVPTRSVADPAITAESGQALHCYDHAGFEMALDLGKLKVRGRWQPAEWGLGVLVGGHGTVRHAFLCAPDEGAAQYVVRDLDEDGADAGRFRLEVGFERGGARGSARDGVRDGAPGAGQVDGSGAGRLVLRVVRHAVRVEGHWRDGDDVVFRGRADRDDTGRGVAGADGAGVPLALRLSRPGHGDPSGTGMVVEVPLAPQDGRFEVRVPLGQLAAVPAAVHRAPKAVPPPDTEPWRADLVMADGSLTPPAAVPGLPPGRYPLGDGRELCATADDRGLLRVELTRRPIADTVTWNDDGTLTISGTRARGTFGAGEAELVLRHARLDEEVTVPFAQVAEPGGRSPDEDADHVLEPAAEPEDQDRFSVTFTPGGGTLGEGRWNVHARDVDQAGHTAGAPGDTAVPLRVLAPLAAALPAHHASAGRDITIDRRHGDALIIDAGSVLPATDRGPYGRRRLRTTHYAEHRERPLREAVLYTAGRGDDSLRAVHEELLRRGAEVEHLWVTRDQRTQVPPAAQAVEEHSADWYEALARCRRVLASDHLPDFFERRPGQTVVQTWHGVPLKRIGTDLAGTPYADHSHLAALPRLAAQWSVLVSPNRFAIGHLCRALAYDGELLQAGSPRNDVLFAPDRDKIADRLRTQLGIERGRRVVLYAPTYRDHAAFEHTTRSTRSAPSAPTHAHDPSFDFRAAERALAGDHVLLVRKHPLTAGRLSGARPPFVRDVTRHPTAAELLLIADVLVTDYSSLMFDFAHTGRPMLFHTHDLEHYRDTARGFTFDFEARAPGPLLASTHEVLSALRDLDAVADEHTDAYAAFRDAYCDLDDGHAAARVADRLTRL